MILKQRNKKNKKIKRKKIRNLKPYSMFGKYTKHLFFSSKKLFLKN